MDRSLSAGNVEHILRELVEGKEAVLSQSPRGMNLNQHAKKPRKQITGCQILRLKKE